MAQLEQLIQEAESRGILTDKAKSLIEEARTKGIIKPAWKPPTPEEEALVPKAGPYESLIYGLFAGPGVAAKAAGTAFVPLAEEAIEKAGTVKGTAGALVSAILPSLLTRRPVPVNVQKVPKSEVAGPAVEPAFRPESISLQSLKKPLFTPEFTVSGKFIKPSPKPIMTKTEALATEKLVAPKIPESLKGVRLTTETTEKVIKATENVMKQLQIPRDPEMPVSIQISKVMTENPHAFPSLQSSLEQTGATIDDFAQMFLVNSSNAGRQLGQLGNLAKRLESEPLLKDLTDAIGRNKPPMTGWELTGHFWGRFINIWRGNLVSAMSTAVRNLETQTIRLPLKALEGAIDGGIRSMFKLGPAETRGLDPSFRLVMEAFHSMRPFKGSTSRKMVQDIVKQFPDEAGELFYRYSSDVAKATRASQRISGYVPQKIEQVMLNAERATDFLNIFNRTQEFFVRKLAFRASMARDLGKTGKALEQVDIRTLDPKMVSKWVEESMDVTYQLNPKSGLGDFVVNRIYGHPIGKTLSFIAPFPRFMYNSWKYVFEHSPAGFLKLLSKSEWAKIGKGDTGTISKALLGSGMLFAAKEVRESEYAGEKWYQIKPDPKSDRRVDIRPFAPFSSYFFIAELMNAERKTPLEAKEIIQGLFSGNFRGGAGLYILDEAQSVVEGYLSGQLDENSMDRLKRFGGEILGGFFQSLTTFRELYAEYGRYSETLKESALEEAKIRDVSEEPFTGPIKRKIPFASQALPEFESPSEAKTPQLEPVHILGIPVSRQFSGLSAPRLAKSTQELTALGFSTWEIRGQKTGIPEADRLIARNLGPLVQLTYDRILESETYQKLPFAMKRQVAQDLLKGLRKEAKEIVFAQRPDLFIQAFRRKLDPEIAEIAGIKK